MKKLIALLLLPFGSLVRAEPVGEVDTVFKFIGPDHKIVVDAHDDPKVSGVTCYVSRAKTSRRHRSIACKSVRSRSP